MKRLFPSLLAIWLLFAACHDTTDFVDALAYKAGSDDKWGLIATDGRVLVPSNTFGQQPATVVNGMFSLPDGKGFYQLYNTEHPTVPVSSRRFAHIGHFFEEVAPAQETPQSPILLVDKKGRTVSSTARYPQYDIVLAHNFREGRALIATREGKYGYMDVEGKIVIPPLYDRAYDFNNGLALVGTNNRQGETGYQLITPNGRNYIAIQLSNCLLSHRFSYDLLMFKDLDNGQCCYMDREGLPLIRLPREVKEAYPFQYGAAVFQTATGTGIIDSRGEALIPAHYENAIIAGSGRAGLKMKGCWTVAEINGKPLSDWQYEALGCYYRSGQAVARSKGKYLFIDRKGQPADENTYALITEDSTARQDIPQVFIRRESEKEESPSEDTGEKKNQPAAPTALKGFPNATPGKKSVPARSIIRSDAWREVSKQNPFYAEANKVLSGKLEEADAERRRMILNYVEHLRTSYTTKDIDFLEQLFSENALIVVGTVIHTGEEAGKGYLSPSQVVYNVKSKRQYLNRLKQVFKANKNIRVNFSRFRIMKHPTQLGIYGVSLRQGYSSDIYSDDGYLFLLWDFRDETAPKIHVRTWQPSLLEDHTPLPEDDIFNIRNFNLR